MLAAIIGGYQVLVDEQDEPLLSANEWRVRNFGGRNGKPYVYRRADPNFCIYLHREILGFPEEWVDHRDGDGLNNQRKNLRLATPSQNQHNQKAQSGKKSKYKGVCSTSAGSNSIRPWRAYIKISGTRLWLGTYYTEKDAADAYDAAARHHFGEFAKTNSEIFSLEG